MPDIASLPAPPTAAPPHAGDAALLTRLPLPSDPPGTAASGYSVPYGALAPAILPKSRVTAGGSTQADATALATPVAIVTAAMTGGGVLLRGIPHDTQTILNASAPAAQVYPPKGPGTSVDGSAGPVMLQPGAQADSHSDDGVSYFVGT